MIENFFIVAVDDKWGLAKEHRIPWHFSEDFAFFKKMTTDAKCIMGYNTYKEIADAFKYPESRAVLLPKRKSFIVTSRDIKVNEDAQILRGLDKEDRFHVVGTEGKTAWIGGPAIYNLAMEEGPYTADYGYITRIKGDYECDAFFNHDLLDRNFYFSDTVGETEDLRFEKWKRKHNET